MEVAATSIRVLSPGWYRVDAEVTGPWPANTRITVQGNDGREEDAIPQGAQAGGRWSRVIVLRQEAERIRLRAERGADVHATGVQVTRISPGAAVWGMLKTVLRAGGSALAPLLVSAARALLLMAPRAFVHDLLAAYPPGAREVPPTLACRVRRHAWSLRATVLPMRAAGHLQALSAPEWAWQSVGEDPQFVSCHRLRRPLPKGWYTFAGTVTGAPSAMRSPCLYPDYGSGPNQIDAIAIPEPGADGRFRQVIVLKQDTGALRFDPCIGAIRFELSEIRLDRISRLSAAGRMLAAVRPDTGMLAELVRETAARGVSAAASRLHRWYGAVQRSDTSYAAWVDGYDSSRALDPALLQARAQALADGPRFSVLLPVYETPERWLRRCLDSVLAQAYPRWELCIADDASRAPHVRQVLDEYARRDARVRVRIRPSNGHISAASNSALEMATGDYVALLDHDDELRPHALLEMAEAIVRQPTLDLLYSDEDKIDERGRRFEPNFKPDWNPDLLLSQNYLCHLTVVRTRLAREVGGFRAGFEGSQDHDLVLRCVERLPGSHIHHVPRVLYHWRAVAGSTALERGAKDYADQAGARAVADHLERTGAGGRVESLSHGHYRVRWPRPEPPPLVSLIIPTRDCAELLQTCVASLLQQTSYPAFELIVVDNQSSEPEALACLERISADPRVRVLRYDAPFNYSAINNFAERAARGSIIGLLNNDLEIADGGWLDEMVGQACRPGVGAVGTMLHFPDGSIQHAGVILGIGGIANHPYLGQPRGYPGHGARALVAQNLSAVTAACLVVSREAYRAAGGLDERLTVAFNDIDFCLRLCELGYRNVWTPFCDVVHHESASRGKDDTPEKARRFATEVDYMHQRWGPLLARDPAYNPNLSLETLNFELAFPPRHQTAPEP